MSIIDEVDFYLEDLKSKFTKINPSDYYLSYSGGRDSHLLYWFLKTWLQKNDFMMWLKYKEIPIVTVNTRMEFPEILRRMIENSDEVLLPELKPFEIKEKYGSPIFSKQQDEFIMRYQKGGRTESLMNRINGKEPLYSISAKAREQLFAGTLPPVSPKCCEYLKKKPFKKYEKENNRKAILGVRGAEGVLRRVQYQSCFNKNGKFSPLWDLDNELFEKIYDKYKIETPEIYKAIDRTGCMGCPYGRQAGFDNALVYGSKARVKFLKEYFKESYIAKRINTDEQQLNIFNYKNEVEN